MNKENILSKQYIWRNYNQNMKYKSVLLKKLKKQYPYWTSCKIKKKKFSDKFVKTTLNAIANVIQILLAKCKKKLLIDILQGFGFFCSPFLKVSIVPFRPIKETVTEKVCKENLLGNKLKSYFQNILKQNKSNKSLFWKCVSQKKKRKSFSELNETFVQWRC